MATTPPAAAEERVATGPCKKMRTAKYEWKITFNATLGLRTLVEVVGNILNRVNLRIIYDSKQQIHFLCIDSVDPGHICMIQARLLCENADVPNDVSFCVNSTILNTCLKNIAGHYSLDIVKYPDSSDIKLEAYETLSNSHCTCYTLNTLLDDSETMQIKNMNYDTTVEIDLGLLRGMIKVAKDLKSDKVEFSVHMPEIEDVDKLRSRFTITSFGEAKQEQSFNSSTTREKNTEANVIRAVTDSASPDATDSVFNCMYRDNFSAEFLGLFLKSMDHQLLTMKLSRGQPLILNYPLGPEKSYICFVLAPKLDGDE